MATRIIQEGDILKTDFACLFLTVGFNLIVFHKRNHFEMGAFFIHKLVNDIFVPMGNKIKEERPVVVEAGKDHNFFNFFVDLFENPL